MNERVEEIRRQWSDNSGPKSPWTDVWDLLRAYDEQATALAQAEREREFERERADNQHEAAEMFQNQYREALQERDHSRGLVNGLIAERNDARAEVERLKAHLYKPMIYQMEENAALKADLARVRAALEKMLDTHWVEGAVTRQQCHCRDCTQARAALTEPTPPQEEPR